MIGSRFDSPSVSLGLRGLLKHTRKDLTTALVIALATHLTTTRLRLSVAERKAAKPLTTQFVKRAPRLSKPLELKKRPRPKKRLIRRHVVAAKARANRGQVSSRVRSIGALGALTRLQPRVRRSASFTTETLEPKAVAQAIEGTKESKHALQMSLEMLDVDALDTGQYQAMVIEAADDKRNIKGYLHLLIAYPYSVRHERFKTQDRMIYGLRRLIAKLDEWTGIEATIEKRITFDSEELFQTPWVYLSLSFSMEPTQRELLNLGKYLLGGGFFFFEGNNWHHWQGERHLVRFVVSALDSQGYRKGVDWEFRSLPNSHAIFHCYYDFPDGVPIGHSTMIKSRNKTGRDDDIEPWNRAIEIGGRLVAFNTNQLYIFAWSDWGHGAGPIGNAYNEYDPTIQFQFGINTIIFALTQEGSITHRLMESVQ